MSRSERSKPVDHANKLAEQNRLLADLVFAAEPSTPVPTCPGWTILQLLRHVGRGDHWAAQIIRDRADGYLDPRQVPDGRPPDDASGARDWLIASSRTVLEAALLRRPMVGRVGRTAYCGQIARASLANATATRWASGASTASS
jgi:hypothetical protein